MGLFFLTAFSILFVSLPLLMHTHVRICVHVCVCKYICIHIHIYSMPISIFSIYSYISCLWFSEIWLDIFNLLGVYGESWIGWGIFCDAFWKFSSSRSSNISFVTFAFCSSFGTLKTQIRHVFIFPILMYPICRLYFVYFFLTFFLSMLQFSK